MKKAQCWENMKKGEAVASSARLSMKASANSDVSDIAERKDQDLMFFADSLAQNKPVVSIRHHNKELMRDPKTTRQTAATSEGKTKLECSRYINTSHFPHASDCAATVTTTLATVICPVTNPENNFASCLFPETGQKWKRI